jgi:Ca-activated chloride channel family protein
VIALVFAQAGEATRSAAEARWHVFGDYYFGDPVALLLAPLAIALALWGRSRRGRDAGRVPALPRALPRPFASRLAWLPTVLQVAALALVAVCLARPLRANALTTTIREGIDIVLAVDRSSSMKYTDLEQQKNRLAVVKEVVADFAARRMGASGGGGDNVALVTFAQFPQLVCPFTLDADALRGFLLGVEMVQHEAEDGTAIGRGLAKAVALLEKSDAKSRVVVLLTDGENNVDDIQPADAADLAAELGVRVYTVLAGRYAFQEDIFGRVYPTDRELDSTELEAIASKTGGQFFRARDREALERVYAEIDALERTERREERYTETYDLYYEILAAALALYALAWLSTSTWARSLP